MTLQMTDGGNPAGQVSARRWLGGQLSDSTHG